MLSIKDAAQAVGVHPKTIRRWEKAGKFESHRTLGNQRRFSPYDLESLVNLKAGITPVTTPGVEDVHTPGVKFKFRFPHWPSALTYTILTGMLLGLINFTYFYIKNSQKIAEPAIQQLDLGNDAQVALPSVANFLNGQITIGSDTGELSFLDQKGNLYVKNSALVQGGLHTPALQLIPSAQPEGQLGRQYVDETSGNLMYFDGLEWIALNKVASAAAFPVVEIASDSAEPMTINQPATILTNLYVPKIIDNNNSAYFLDPSATDLSLSVNGNATISSTLTFSKNGEFITNSVDNYLIFSGGIGIGGITSYGFSPEFKLNVKNASIETDLFVGSNIYINGTKMTVPDYVFETDYQLLSPISLEEFIKIHKHLPGIASATEIKASGLNLSQIVLQILEQVENNVLYILDLNKRLAVVEEKMLSPVPDSPAPAPSPLLTASLNEPDLTEIIKNKVSELTQKYAEATATASAFTPGVEDVHTPGVDSLASPSANLDLDSISVNSGFFKDYLAVIGQTTMTDLKINNRLTLGSISALDGKLDLLAGLMTLDETGNVVINGNLAVSGAIIASQIKAPENATLEISIATASAPIATFSGEMAQFNQLGLLNSGSATVSAGTNQTIIPAKNITSQSQVIVTFNDNYAPASKYWIVKDILNQQFIVFTNYPVNNDSLVDWLIIN